MQLEIWQGKKIRLEQEVLAVIRQNRSLTVREVAEEIGICIKVCAI